jgi:integrase/recombinase XerD
MDQHPVLHEPSYLGSIAGELGARSRRIYENDAAIFAKWLQDRHITPESIDRQTVTDYRAWLVENYRTATAKRMFSVARRILDEQVRMGVLKTNDAKSVRGIKAEDDSPHIALSKEQASDLLDAIATNTKRGKRDYAIVMCLLYTGIRRFECASLTIGDMGMEQGHHILTVQGKGNRREIVKLRVEVWRAIDEYLQATGRATLVSGAPLFCQFRKGDHPVEEPIGNMVVYRTILAYAKEAGIEAHLTPHGMRASFVTLSLEGGAKLEQVQMAARHKDPRTTERYWRRRNQLDDNAVDYIKLKER